jgi:hypothetical protein
MLCFFAVMIHENKIPPSLSQAFTTHHPNVFTLILSLSEGRAGIAWVPSNYALPPPPYVNRLSLSPNVFSLFLLFCYPSWLFASLSVFRRQTSFRCPLDVILWVSKEGMNVWNVSYHTSSAAYFFMIASLVFLIIISELCLITPLKPWVEVE